MMLSMRITLIFHPRNRPFCWTEGGNMYGDTFYRRQGSADKEVDFLFVVI